MEAVYSYTLFLTAPCFELLLKMHIHHGLCSGNSFANICSESLSGTVRYIVVKAAKKVPISL